MFTGIVKGTFPVKYLVKSPGKVRFSVQLPPDLSTNLAIGASVAVDGVCLTATAICDGEVFFDVISETLAKTTLDTLEVNRLVNIERSLCFGDEVGGHLVSGHVFGTAVIEVIERPENNHIVCLRCPIEWMRYILPKGFIALDGASLTVAETKAEGIFTVHLIPETLRMTTFGFKKAGDRINVEIDSKTQAIVDTLLLSMK
jgi:riboflavin synthase